MGTPIAILIVAAGLSVTMAAAFFIAVGTGRSGWIDAVWSFAVGIFGAGAALFPFSNLSHRQWLVAGLALAWSLRLGIHIAARTAGMQPAGRVADPRGEVALARVVRLAEGRIVREI